MTTLRRFAPFVGLGAIFVATFIAATVAWDVRTALFWAGALFLLSFSIGCYGEDDRADPPARVYTNEDIANLCDFLVPGCDVETSFDCPRQRIDVIVRIGWRALLPGYARAVESRLRAELAARGLAFRTWRVEVRR